MLKRLICTIVGHKKNFWSNERRKEVKALGGIYTPFDCERCHYHSQVFHWPRVDNTDLNELLKKATEVANS